MSELQQRYEAWHDHWTSEEDAHGGALEHPWHKTIEPFVRQWAPESRDVLEVGCGRGDFAIWIAKQYPHTRVTGVDFSETAIATAKRRAEGVPNVRFAVADAQALQFGDATFDLVISCETLEHVPDPSRMACEMRRVLRWKCSHFILTTENYFNGMLIAWARAWVTNKPFDSGSGPQPHENFFLYWRVKRVLEEAGLLVTHMRSNHFQWLLLPRVAPATLCTETFTNRKLNRLFRPFGRHFMFAGHR